MRFPELAGKTVLITGGTGFVGRSLVESFCTLDTGGHVVVLSRHPEQHESIEGVVEIVGDLRQVTHCDFVIHCATPSARELAGDSSLFTETIELTRTALEFAAGSGSRRFLYASSGAVYGPQPSDLARVPEEFTGAPDSLDVQSAYAETKRAGELLCAAYNKRVGLETVVARGFAFIGKYLPLGGKFAVGSFLFNALNGAPIEVTGDGTAIRSFLSAEEMAEWFWAILLRGAPGRAYNVGSETPVTIAELALETAKLADPAVPVAILGTADPARAAERYVPSTARARRELGVTESVDWRIALRTTYEWHRARVAAEGHPS